MQSTHLMAWVVQWLPTVRLKRMCLFYNICKALVWTLTTYLERNIYYLAFGIYSWFKEHMFNCLTYIANQLITWHQISALRVVKMMKCWCQRMAGLSISECSTKILKIFIHSHLLSWMIKKQIKYPVGGSCVDRYVLLRSEVKRQYLWMHQSLKQMCFNGRRKHGISVPSEKSGNWGQVSQVRQN